MAATGEEGQVEEWEEKVQVAKHGKKAVRLKNVFCFCCRFKIEQLSPYFVFVESENVMYQIPARATSITTGRIPTLSTPALIKKHAIGGGCTVCVKVRVSRHTQRCRPQSTPLEGIINRTETSVRRGVVDIALLE